MNNTTLRVISALSGGVLLVLLALPGAALAHERRTLANGKYDVVVGWDVEPAYVGFKNAASIRIMDAGTTNPVTGAEKTLKIAIRQGANTQSFPLRAVFGQNGYYVADIQPTRVGDYQWSFTGDIGGNAVNETFDTADGKFNGIEPVNALQFPVQLGDPTTAQTAQAEAQNARMLAMLGIGVGVLGVLVGLGAWLTRPRAAAQGSTASVATRPASERA